MKERIREDLLSYIRAEGRGGFTFRTIQTATKIDYDTANENMKTLLLTGAVERFKTSGRCKDCARITKTASMSRAVFFTPSEFPHYLKHRRAVDGEKNQIS